MHGSMDRWKVLWWLDGWRVEMAVLARTAGISLGCNPLCMGQAWVLEYAPLDGCTQCGRLQKENHA